MKLRALRLNRALVRCRRFGRSLWSSFRYAVNRRGRALRRPREFGVVRAVRRAVLVSDPEWAEKRIRSLAYTRNPAREAQLAAAAQARAQTRARRLAEGPAVYCGRLRARVVMRGMRLDDLDGGPDLEDWLAEILGLDDYAGDTARVRLQVELLPEPDSPRDA